MTGMQEKEIYEAPVCMFFALQQEGVVCASGEGASWAGDY